MRQLEGFFLFIQRVSKLEIRYTEFWIIWISKIYLRKEIEGIFMHCIYHVVQSVIQFLVKMFKTLSVMYFNL